MQEVSQLGLGLAFCKMAVRAHQGTITVEDNYPKGSVFTVLLRNIRNTN
jgi:signal transduction histidine kinase